LMIANIIFFSAKVVAARCRSRNGHRRKKGYCWSECLAAFLDLAREVARPGFLQPDPGCFASTPPNHCHPPPTLQHRQTFSTTGPIDTWPLTHRRSHSLRSFRRDLAATPREIAPRGQPSSEPSSEHISSPTTLEPLRNDENDVYDYL
jgi:hypothetical protein